MATADVSRVPADQKAILGSLNNLFNFCMQAANTPGMWDAATVKTAC
jgi:hypothetical protein